MNTHESEPNTNSIHKPLILITVDAEGDNLWDKPHTITTRNAEFIPRFQTLCETYGLKPTYLTNYEMAQSHFFQDFCKDILKRNTGEIGMHLHAWNNPPLSPITRDDFFYQPYLVQYPKNIMQEKITVITDLLETIFDVKMISHRAGRWIIDEIYAQLLVEHGYLVDCSVTPHVSWNYMNDTNDHDETRYFLNFPDKPYFLNLNEINRRGESQLLEIPVTILSNNWPKIDSFRWIFEKFSLTDRLLDHFYPSISWFRPTKRNFTHLRNIINTAVTNNHDYIEFMVHSSELMPGGSPSFPNSADIELLYRNLEILFDDIQYKFIGVTLKEFYQIFSEFNNDI